MVKGTQEENEVAVTLKEVAQKAGVSRSAHPEPLPKVRLFLPKRKRLKRPPMRWAIARYACLKPHNRPDKAYRTCFKQFQNPIFLHVFDLFTKSLQEQGLRPLLVNLSDQIDPANSVRMLRQYSVDGVIVLRPQPFLTPSFAKAFKDARMPVVHSFGRHANAPDVHVVGIDNVECGRMAARSLIERGYQHVGFLGGPESAINLRWTDLPVLPKKWHGTPKLN